MTASVGDVILEAFQGQGIDHIFCSPGSEWVSVWEGLARRYGTGDKSPKYINCRHEMMAVAAASGYIRATGHPAAVLLHAGIGALNAAMGLRSASRFQVHVPGRRAPPRAAQRPAADGAGHFLPADGAGHFLPAHGAGRFRLEDAL